MNLTGILEIAGRTDTGCVRTQNEDTIGEEVELGTVVLADGMGGYHGGEVASGIAVNTILNFLHEHIPAIKKTSVDRATGLSAQSLLAEKAIHHANLSILKTAKTQDQYKGMGTTIVMGIFHDNRLTIAHVGDSRMYRYREGQLETLTNDHTLLQELIDRGLYTEEEARHSLNRNLVTRALGIDETVDVDVHETMAQPNDIYLLCSDGLNDMIEDTDIAQTLQTYQSQLQKCADHLVKLAKDSGGKDNVSVILARPLSSYPARQENWYSRTLRKLKN